MAGIADLDAALDAFEKASDAAETEIENAVNDLLTKVGGTVDVSAEVARIQAAQQKLQQAADAIQTQDQGTNPVPPGPPQPPVPPQP